MKLFMSIHGHTEKSISFHLSRIKKDILSKFTPKVLQEDFFKTEIFKILRIMVNILDIFTNLMRKQELQQNF